MNEEEIKRMEKVKGILKEEGATEVKLVDVGINEEKIQAIAGRIADIMDENKRRRILIKVGTKLNPGEKLTSSVRDGFLVISFGKIVEEEGKAEKEARETAAKSRDRMFSLEEFGIPVL